MIKGFEKAKKRELKRLIGSAEGPEKTGKTTFGLSMPGPIALFDLDIGTEGVVDKVLESKEIFVVTTNYRDTTDPKEWEKMWELMKDHWYAALEAKKEHCRSLLADTATEMWELIRLARFGKLSEVKPHHYGPINAEFRDLIRKAYDYDKNLILLHKQKDEYVNDKATGKVKRAGFGDIGYLVQVNFITWWKKDEGFGITIKDCRQNMDLAGMNFMGDMVNFEAMASMIDPEWRTE